MALGDRASGRAKTSERRPPSAMDSIDDLYENNAFGDDDGEADALPVRANSVGVAARKSAKSPATATTDKSGDNNSSIGEVAAAAGTNGVQFDVWVARKDKYERIARALAQLNVERANDDAQWLEVAVALAATDCLLKTGRVASCDCPGVCRESSHAVTRQRARCACPAKKCSLCARCVGTSPGEITDKMVAALAPFRSDGSTGQMSVASVLEVAEQVQRAGEGKSVASGGPKVSRAALRMAQSALAQCSVLENADGARVQRPCACPVASLGDLWVKWTTRWHTFSRVPLSTAEAQRFAAGTRQMMEQDGDTLYMTLKWHQAAKPQKGDTAKIAARRMLTPDQKQQNAVRPHQLTTSSSDGS